VRGDLCQAQRGNPPWFQASNGRQQDEIQLGGVISLPCKEVQFLMGKREAGGRSKNKITFTRTHLQGKRK